MYKMQMGLLWLEILIVVLVLAVLAAFAIPRWIDLEKNINSHVISRLATAISAANDSNRVKKNNNFKKGFTIKNCIDGVKLLNEKLPVGFFIQSLPISVASTVKCALLGPQGVRAEFTLTGVK